MYNVYDKWPEIAKVNYELELEEINMDDISHIVFAGMGGSGALSDIFYSILSKTNLHVEVVKGYHLPRTVNSHTLIITTSISGNTDETLTVLDQANKSTCKIVAFSSGGKMQRFCYENKIEHRMIEMIHSPRASFVPFLYGMLKVLKPIISVKEADIFQSINDLVKLRKKIFSKNLVEDNPALSLAEWITDIPIIYYPWGLQASAIRFKNSLQENAKIHGIAEDVIESCHNGIVPWTKPSSWKPILIEGEDDYIKTKERWKILKEYLKEKNVEYQEVHSISGSILSKLINLIYLFDYTSIYRAILSEIDPTPVEAIDFVKSKLLTKNQIV